MARNVLQHHDGVVDDKAGGHGHGHEREVVDAVAQQVHDAEGAGQRNRHGDRRQQGGAQVAQKSKHHHDHQPEGNGQGALNLFDGGANRGRAVHHHVDIDGRRNGSAQLRQQGAHVVHGIDHVGAWRLGQDHDHGLATIGQTVVAHVLHRIGDVGDIAHLHGIAAGDADNQRCVVGGFEGLVVGAQLPVAPSVFEEALGPVGVAGDHRGANGFQRDAIGGQAVGVEFNAHRGQGAAADRHLSDAIDLREALRQDGGGGIVHLPARERI